MSQVLSALSAFFALAWFFIFSSRVLVKRFRAHYLGLTEADVRPTSQPRMVHAVETPEEVNDTPTGSPQDIEANEPLVDERAVARTNTTIATLRPSASVRSLQQAAEPDTGRPWVRAFSVVSLLLIPYTILGTVMIGEPKGVTWGGFFEGFYTMVFYIYGATALLIWRFPSIHDADFISDVAAVLWLWLPIELDWLPSVDCVVFGLNIPIVKLIAINLSFYLFNVVRLFTVKLGYTYYLTRYDVLRAVAAFGAFAIIGIPIGASNTFIIFQVREGGFFSIVGSIFLIYFFIGIPEEMLFRGVIQAMFEERLDSILPPSWAGRRGAMDQINYTPFEPTESMPEVERVNEANLSNKERMMRAIGLPSRNATIAWIVASIIFGLSHLNNAVKHGANYPEFTEPNWMYAFMATLAGLGYGWVWRKSDKITASAITHMLVDWMWFTFLGG